MTEATADDGPDISGPDRARPSDDPVLKALFAVAVFTSASLVFVVQPMVTKLVLPMLGGSPSVWNTSMVFFQTALLAGYAYAHALQRLSSMRSQLAVHLSLLALAALFLPLKINGVLGDPDPSAPIGWLLATLALSVGAPFAVLSATAPLMQAWYARVRAGQADGQNPYVLYAASNLGSFLVLLAYPVLIEPLTTLSGQRAGWTGGYALFLIVVVLLAGAAWRRGGLTTLTTPALERSPPIPWLEKAKLVLIAAAPSSLMLGVTQHLSTDVASAPFLWIIPLALYLLTFVIAFQARPWIPLRVSLVVQAAVAALCLVMLPFRNGDWALIFCVHLAAFFFTALACHQLLAARKPAPDRLTEFFLLLSLGGVVGGAFTALLAPVIFDNVWEYPLVLVLVGLARPWHRSEIRNREVYLIVAAVLVCGLPPLLSAMFKADWSFAWWFSEKVSSDMPALTQAILMAAALMAFLLRNRTPAFVVICALIALSSHTIARGYAALHTDRSFFGVLRIGTTEDPRLGGTVHILTHGTTLHGSQARAPAFACTPTLYYAPVGPLGQVMQTLQARNAGRGVVTGVVGQGSGAMAAYKRAEDRLTYFEIDPMVDRLSRDPQWFTYIDHCADGPVRTVLGDARLSMARERPGTYDYLVIDAFSSDAVPTHLLTEEAIKGYLRLLKPDGVLLLHLSNRNLDITGPAQAAAVALGAPYLHQLYVESPTAPDMAEASTEALILSPSERGLEPFRNDPRWRTLPPTTVRPWTDDYVNLFGSLWRHFRAHG